MYLGLFFIKNLCKRVCFFEILCTEGSLAKFCDFLQFFVFKSSNSCTCLGAKLLHNYLFRVEKRKKNTCLGCQIPLLYLFRDTNFSQGNICLGYFLRVHGRAWYPRLPFEWLPRDFLYEFWWHDFNIIHMAPLFLRHCGIGHLKN